MPSDDRRFARLHDQVRTRMHPAVAAPVGALSGAVALCGAYAWEVALWNRIGDTVPETLFQTDLPAVAVLGAGMGLLCGVTGLWGSRWLLAFGIGTLGWWAGGPLAVAIPDVPPGIVVVLVWVLSLAAGQGLARVPMPEALRRGVGAWLALMLALAAPVHAHLLPAAADGTGVVMTALLGALAVPVALAAIPLAELGRGMLVPLLAFGLCGAGLAAATQGPQAWPQAEAGEGPLLVLVTVSGLRADRMGGAGYSRDVTPELDRFARTAVSYAHASATAPWSVPSIGSILTARLPYHHGAGARRGGRATDSALRTDVPSWPSQLRQAGYATVASVGDPSLQAYGLDRGFQRWVDTPLRGPLSVWLRPAVLAGVADVPVRVHADIVVDQALAFLSARPEGRRLLYVHFADASGPFDATAEDLDRMGRTTRSAALDAHDAALHRVDAAIRRLLDALPTGAVVVVAGDRGVRLGEPRGAGHLWGQNLHPELLHVPLLVRAGGTGSRRTDTPVSLVDIGPTLLHAAGLAAPDEVDGVMLGTAFGAREVERVVRAEATRYGPDARSARRGRYRVVSIGDREMVYDVSADPLENEPLAANPSMAAELRGLRAALPPDAATTLEPGLGPRLGRVLSRLVP